MYYGPYVSICEIGASPSSAIICYFPNIPVCIPPDTEKSLHSIFIIFSPNIPYYPLGGRGLIIFIPSPHYLHSMAAPAAEHGVCRLRRLAAGRVRGRPANKYLQFIFGPLLHPIIRPITGTARPGLSVVALHCLGLGGFGAHRRPLGPQPALQKPASKPRNKIQLKRPPKTGQDKSPTMATSLGQKRMGPWCWSTGFNGPKGGEI